MRNLALLLAVTATSSACVELDDETLAETTQDVLLPSYSVVSRSATTSRTGLSTAAYCPANTVVLGGSFAAVDSTGAYLLTVSAQASAPTAGNSGWIVSAQNSQRGTWTLRVNAICATAPAGYSVALSPSLASTAPTRQESVACPAGKRSTGGGYVLAGSGGSVIAGDATYFMPSWDGASWLANAHANAPAKWSLQLYAVCVDNVLPGYEVATTTSVLDSLAFKQVTGACSAGKVATGAGWGVLDSTNAILEGRATTHDIGFTSSYWITSAEKLSSFSPDWRLQQRAICVN